MIRGMRAGLNGARASYHWNSDLALGQQDRTSSGAACWGISAAIRRTVIESSHIGQILWGSPFRPVCSWGRAAGNARSVSPVGRAGGFTDPLAALPIPLVQVYFYWGLSSGAIHCQLGFWPMRNPAMQYLITAYDDSASRMPPLWSMQHLEIGNYPGELRYLGVWDTTNCSFYSASKIDATRAPPALGRVETGLAV